MSRRILIPAIAAIALIVLAGVLYFQYGRKGLSQKMTVEHDRKYQMMGIELAKVKTLKGEWVHCYRVSIVFPVYDQKEKRAFNVAKDIFVPRTATVIDRTLPRNCIVWPASITVDGISYQPVPWNPCRTMAEATVEEQP